MAFTLYETQNFKLTALRVGLVLTSKITEVEVYFQPGDDEATMRESVEAIETEISGEKQDTIFDMIMADYFA